MALTAKEIYDLNHMNVAAQNVQLGTILNKLITGGGGGGASIDWDNLDENTRARILAAIENEESGGEKQHGIEL